MQKMLNHLCLLSHYLQYNNKPRNQQQLNEENVVWGLGNKSVAKQLAL